MNTDGLEKDDLTKVILGAAFEVANTLGHGFLERIYQRALAYELETEGIHVEREVTFRVVYKDTEIGVYVADMVVSGDVIVELKTIDAPLSTPQLAQCLNYLRVSGLKRGLVINFGRPRLEYRRIVL